MNLPVQMNKDLSFRLIQRIEERKFYGNPFSYVLTRPDGENIVEAVCRTTPTILQPSVSLLADYKAAYDIYNELCDLAEISHREGRHVDGSPMHEVVDSVLTLLTIGLSVETISTLFRKEYEYQLEANLTRPSSKALAFALAIRACSDIANAEYREHDRRICEMDNAMVHDENLKCG